MEWMKKLIRKFNQDTRLSAKFVSAIIILIVLPLLLLSLVFYFKFQQIIENEVSSSYEQVVSQYASQVENKFILYRNLLDTIAVNGVVQDIFSRQDEIKLKDSIEIGRQFSREIENQIFARNSREIYNIVVYAKNPKFPSDGSHTSNIGLIKGEPWYPAMIANADTKAAFAYTIKALNIDIVSLAKRIPNLAGNQYAEWLGYVKIDLKASELFHLDGQENRLSSNNLYILDQQGGMLYTSDGKSFADLEPSALQKLLSDGSGKTTVKSAGNRIMIARRIAGTDWTAFMLFQNNELNARVLEIGTFILLLVGLIIIVLILCSFLFSRVFIKRTDSLINKINHIENGDLDLMAPIEGKDEIATIDLHFNRMVARLNELIKENYIQHIEKREAELKALQFQINPHFLYNTLESISAMAAIQGCREIGTISEKLGMMFRYSINKERSEFVPLAEEIKHIQNYFYIQKVRFGSGFTTIVDIPDNLMKCRILRFILQPIVENAVIHGFGDKAGQGCLEISAAVEDNSLVLTVYDDGRGMPEEQANQLNNLLNEPENKITESSRESIGVKNVNARIKLVCGSRYGIVIRSKPGAGTQVRITLPLYGQGG